MQEVALGFHACLPCASTDGEKPRTSVRLLMCSLEPQKRSIIRQVLLDLSEKHNVLLQYIFHILRVCEMRTI